MSGGALALAWDHLRCEAMQIMIPLEQPASFVATAALGEQGPAIVGARLQLPAELHETYFQSREPTTISTQSLRFIWEKREGAIVSLVAQKILWMPVFVDVELVAVMIAINPTKADDFADGDLKGAAYLVKTVGEKLAGFARGESRQG